MSAMKETWAFWQVPECLQIWISWAGPDDGARYCAGHQLHCEQPPDPEYHLTQPAAVRLPSAASSSRHGGSPPSLTTDVPSTLPCRPLPGLHRSAALSVLVSLELPGQRRPNSITMLIKINVIPHQLKTHYKDKNHGSKTTNIILPRIVEKHKWSYRLCTCSVF